MKRRITFIPYEDNVFDPTQLNVQGDAIQITGLRAAREERWTTSLDDLPQELWLALRHCQELHVRWALHASYNPTTPFLSPTLTGLTALFTPQRNSTADSICPILTGVFGSTLNCSSSKSSFIEAPVTVKRLQKPATLYYHQELPSVSSLIRYLRKKLCRGDATCDEDAEFLSHAVYVDVDFDTISRSVSLTAFWHNAPHSQEWTEKVESLPQSKVEIGILAKEKAMSPGEITLGGQLITLGDDKELKPTLFSFPSRHHSVPTTYTASINRPAGLHPKLQLIVSKTDLMSNLPRGCRLHAHVNLPSAIFPDKYQFSQPNLLKSNNIVSIRALSPSKPDLEAPEWAVQEWGSALLLELVPPPSDERSVKDWTATLPLHLRYMSPLPSSDFPEQQSQHNKSHSTHGILTIPQPLVFWACPSTVDGPELDTNPFDRMNLGYDGAFGRRTTFWHLIHQALASSSADQASGNDIGALELEVPVLDLTQTAWVDSGTVIAVVAGFLWVCWCLARVWLGRDSEGPKKAGSRDKGD